MPKNTIEQITCNHCSHQFLVSDKQIEKISNEDYFYDWVICPNCKIANPIEKEHKEETITIVKTSAQGPTVSENKNYEVKS